ncbi:hypothetical protein [Spirosoma aerophilum]
MSTTTISANPEVNSQILNDLLETTSEPRMQWISMRMKRSSNWLSTSKYLGVDDDNYLMYGLTRSESVLFTVGTIVGLTIIGTLVNWLFL